MSKSTEETYKKLYKSLKSGTEQLQRELNICRAQNTLLKAAKLQWEAEKIRHQEIIQQTINQTNLQSQQYLEENKQLKA